MGLVTVLRTSMGDLSLSQQQHPPAGWAESVPARAGLRYPDGAGTARSRVRAGPSRVPVRARDVPGPSEHNGPSAGTEPPAGGVRPSRVPVSARAMPRPSDHHGPSAGAEPSAVGELASRAGSELEPSVRARMERWFGADFIRVRVHTGMDAQRSAEA